MGNDSLNLHGFNFKRKDGKNGRAGGVVCYLRTALLYSRLTAYEDDELEVIWIKVMPKRLARTVSSILIACIYYTQQTDYLKMREHIITSIDAVIRKHPDCGIIVTGDFNQLNDTFLKTHYRFVQIVNVGTRGNAVLKAAPHGAIDSQENTRVPRKRVNRIVWQAIRANSSVYRKRVNRTIQEL